MHNNQYELREEERTRCEIWTRVMGYHRPVSQFNPGKQAEHGERRYYRQAGMTQQPDQPPTIQHSKFNIQN